jgi:pilus assembly protein CpaF
MFTIVISEKGGAERREAFDKNEVNVGRVQGNDLMLPKGNVSKHHARLLYRDGRFIVTDLKSTNGTYVNGRKISQATIVREGDKIYIGDFVLRLQTGLQALAEPSYADVEAAAASAPPPASRVGATPKDGVLAGGMPLSARAVPPPMQGGAPSAATAAATVAAPLASSPRLADPDAVSHYPLERDPDESQSAPELHGASAPRAPASAHVPPPPRVPQQSDMRSRANTMLLGDEPPPVSRSAASGARSARAPRSVPPPPHIARPGPRETPQQAARRVALITLVDRVADVVDLPALEHSPLIADGMSQAIERAVREQAKAMRQEGEAPDGIDLESLARDALRELVALGPIGPLLDDDETTEVHVVRPDYVLAMKNGQTTLAEPSFTSEEAFARVIARLAHQSGDPLRAGELVIDRRLPRGAYMMAIAPPAATGWVLHVRKRRRIESSLAQLVQSGTMSEEIAQFLEACAAVRANVLVVGSGAGAVAVMLGAIASAAPQGERVALLERGADEIALPQAHVVPLALIDHGSRGEESVYAAARLGLDRIIIASLGGSVATATIDVIAEGSEGVLAGVGAPSLGHALARLVSQVALARAGSSVEAAREAVGRSFDVAVEIDRVGGGRLCVTRVVELEGSDERRVVTRDLFVLTDDGSGDASYVTTDVSPRIARDFASRGLRSRPSPR